MAETLGILVTRHENSKHIIGITKAARAVGKAVAIFLTDEGVRFTQDTGFLELLKLDDVEISCCDHSCECIGLQGKTDGILYESQYKNAGMLHECARVLVF